MSQLVSTSTLYNYTKHQTNSPTGEDVPFFIASEYYKPINAANPNHISKIAEKTEDGG